MPSSSQRQRTDLRQKLYGAVARTPDADGGGVVDHVFAMNAWPKFLDIEFAAARPTLHLPDVKHMLETQTTPLFNSMEPRTLADCEIQIIQSWYDAEVKMREKKLGTALATAQSTITTQASANHVENVCLHHRTHDALDKLQRGHYIDIDGATPLQLQSSIATLQNEKKKKRQQELLLKAALGISNAKRLKTSPPKDDGKSVPPLKLVRRVHPVTPPPPSIKFQVSHVLSVKLPKIGMAMLDGSKLVENRNYKLPLGWHWIYVSKCKDQKGLEKFKDLLDTLAYASEVENRCHGHVIGGIFISKVTSPDKCNGNQWAIGPKCHVITHSIPLQNPVAIPKPGARCTRWSVQGKDADLIRAQISDDALIVHDVSSEIK